MLQKKPSELKAGDKFQIGATKVIVAEQVGPNRAYGQTVIRFLPTEGTFDHEGTIIFPLPEDDFTIHVFDA